MTNNNNNNLPPGYMISSPEEEKNGKTTIFAGECYFIGIQKEFNLGLTKCNAGDWALCYPPHDNGHVT